MSPRVHRHDRSLAQLAGHEAREPRFVGGLASLATDMAHAPGRASNPSPPVRADQRRVHAGRPGSARRAPRRPARHGHDIAALVLAEQDRRPAIGQAGADRRAPMPERHRHLGQRDGEAAVGEVVARRSTAPSRISARTKSPTRFSCARSTGGGAPSLAAVDVAQVDRLAEMRAPRRSGAPTRTMASPLGLEADVASSRPVGEQADAADGRGRQDAAGRWSRCRARRCPDTIGKSSARQASPMPRMASTSWPMISGRSGLPKLRLSVAASGSAPTAVRLRQHSATACLPPSNGIGLAVARRHVGGEGEAPCVAWPSTRTTPASPPGRCSELPWISVSYCS